MLSLPTEAMLLQKLATVEVRRCRVEDGRLRVNRVEGRGDELPGYLRTHTFTGWCCATPDSPRLASPPYWSHSSVAIITFISSYRVKGGAS